MKLIIRPFAAADQAAAEALIFAGLAERWGRLDPSLNEDVRDIAGNYQNGCFLVAVADEKLVGTGALIPETTGVMRIVRMSVAKTVRRQGVGQAILERLIVEARARECRRLLCETTKSWTDAIAFYQQNGFHTAHVDDHDHHFYLTLNQKN